MKEMKEEDEIGEIGKLVEEFDFKNTFVKEEMEKEKEMFHMFMVRRDNSSMKKFDSKTRKRNRKRNKEKTHCLKKQTD